MENYKNIIIFVIIITFFIIFFVFYAFVKEHFNMNNINFSKFCNFYSTFNIQNIRDNINTKLLVKTNNDDFKHGLYQNQVCVNNQCLDLTKVNKLLNSEQILSTEDLVSKNETIIEDIVQFFKIDDSIDPVTKKYLIKFVNNKFTNFFTLEREQNFKLNQKNKTKLQALQLIKNEFNNYIENELTSQQFSSEFNNFITTNLEKEDDNKLVNINEKLESLDEQIAIKLGTDKILVDVINTSAYNDLDDTQKDEIKKIKDEVKKGTLNIKKDDLYETDKNNSNRKRAKYYRNEKYNDYIRLPNNKELNCYSKKHWYLNNLNESWGFKYLFLRFFYIYIGYNYFNHRIDTSICKTENKFYDSFGIDNKLFTIDKIKYITNKDGGKTYYLKDNIYLKDWVVDPDDYNPSYKYDPYKKKGLIISKNTNSEHPSISKNYNEYILDPIRLNLLTVDNFGWFNGDYVWYPNLNEPPPNSSNSKTIGAWVKVILNTSGVLIGENNTKARFSRNETGEWKGWWKGLSTPTTEIYSFKAGSENDLYPGQNADYGGTWTIPTFTIKNNIIKKLDDLKIIENLYYLPFTKKKSNEVNKKCAIVLNEKDKFIGNGYTIYVYSENYGGLFQTKCSNNSLNFPFIQQLEINYLGDTPINLQKTKPVIPSDIFRTTGLDGMGGIVCQDQTNFVIRDCIFRGAIGFEGGGICGKNTANTGEVFINNCFSYITQLGIKDSKISTDETLITKTSNGGGIIGSNSCKTGKLYLNGCYTIIERDYKYQKHIIKNTNDYRFYKPETNEKMDYDLMSELLTDYDINYGTGFGGIIGPNCCEDSEGECYILNCYSVFSSLYYTNTNLELLNKEKNNDTIHRYSYIPNKGGGICSHNSSKGGKLNLVNCFCKFEPVLDMNTINNINENLEQRFKMNFSDYNYGDIIGPDSNYQNIILDSVFSDSKSTQYSLQTTIQQNTMNIKPIDNLKQLSYKNINDNFKKYFMSNLSEKLKNKGYLYSEKRISYFYYTYYFFMFFKKSEKIPYLQRFSGKYNYFYTIWYRYNSFQFNSKPKLIQISN